MAACLRDFGQCDVEAILLENSGFLGKRQRSKAGPAGKAKGNGSFSVRRRR